MAATWTRLGREVRQATRRLRRSPGFTAAAVLPLALGIGAAATIFTFLHDVVLQPFPYPEADRLVVVRNALPGYEVDGRIPEVGAFMGQYLHFRERSRSLADLGGYWTFEGTLVGEEGAEHLHLGGATVGLWRALGIRPVEGRFFRDDDPWPSGEGQGVTLLDHGFWMERYGGGSAVGRTVTTGGWTYRIVGVLPPSLPFAGARPTMWNAIPDAQARANPEWTMPVLVGRLAPGATAEALERELGALTAELPERYPDATTIANSVARGRMTPRVMSLRAWVLGGVERAIWLLFASVLLLFVVAVVNVGGLLLVRADGARRELAVRLALGSGTRDLALGILVENALLVGGAGLLGLGLAHVSVPTMIRTVPTEVPRIGAVAAGGEAAAFILVLASLCAAALAVVRLLHSRRSPAATLHGTGRGATGGSTRLPLRRAFVSLQIAVALMLSIGAGLVFRSAWRLSRTDPGFPVDSLLTVRVPFPFSEVQAAGARGTTATAFYEELTRRLQALPGVEAVAWGSCVPLSRFCDSGGFAIRTVETGAAGEAPAASAVHASPGYIGAFGIPLLEGRHLTAEDHRTITNRVLVSESLARRLWPGESPLGRTFTPVAFGQATDPSPFTVAGVVADVRFDELRREAGAMVYMPVLVADRPGDVTMANFVLRTSVPPLSLMDAVRRTVAELRPDIAVASAETMESSFARETAAVRFASVLVMVAAGATLLLSVLGVYGVLAYAVGLRRPEFGIRLAMGASGGELRRMVLAQGLTTAGVGVATGLLGAAAASSLIRSLLFGVPSDDPATYVAATALLLVAAAGATYLPARRASRLDPAQALYRD